MCLIPEPKERGLAMTQQRQAVSRIQALYSVLQYNAVRFKQIHVPIWTNTLGNSNKYILPFVKTKFRIWTSMDGRV